MTVSNDIHLSPVRRHAAAMVWAPVALCRRLVPPHSLLIKCYFILYSVTFTYKVFVLID